MDGTIWTDIDDSRLYKQLDLQEVDRLFSAYQKNGIMVSGLYCTVLYCTVLYCTVLHYGECAHKVVQSVTPRHCLLPCLLQSQGGISVFSVNSDCGYQPEK